MVHKLKVVNEASLYLIHFAEYEEMRVDCSWSFAFYSIMPVFTRLHTNDWTLHSIASATVFD